MIMIIYLIAVPRNYDPALHPFELPREYTRALNATKLDRIFAKPFVASLDGHRDGVNCIAKHPESLSTVLSGACDGEVSIIVRQFFSQNYSPPPPPRQKNPLCFLLQKRNSQQPEINLQVFT